MRIERDYTQHYVFERLSKIPNINVFVIDYDTDKRMKNKSVLIKKHIYTNIHRSVKASNVKIIRTAHIQILYLRRISSVFTNFFEIINIIRKHGIDLIVSFSISNGLIGLIISKIFKIPFIFYYIDLLHTLITSKFIQYPAEIISTIIFKFSDYNIVVTQLLKEYIVNRGISSSKVKVLLNGISLENTIIDKDKLKTLKEKFNFEREI